MKLKFRISTSIIATILISMLFSCEDEVGYNIPYVYVNMPPINLALPECLPFKSGNAIPLDSIYPNSNEGYAGIIIIKGVDFSTGYDKYYAFDQCCPAHVEDRHKLIPDGFVVRCPEKNISYSVIDGSGLPIEGESSHPLKPYKTSLSGTKLRVFN